MWPSHQKRVLPEQGYISNPELEDLDLLQDSFNFSRWGGVRWDGKRRKVKYFLSSILGEDHKDLEDRLKVIVSSMENLVRSLRAREELNLGPACDVDKILAYYRQSNHPFIINVGGLRFRCLSISLSLFFWSNQPLVFWLESKDPRLASSPTPGSTDWRPAPTLW